MTILCNDQFCFDQSQLTVEAELCAMQSPSHQRFKIISTRKLSDHANTNNNVYYIFQRTLVGCAMKTVHLTPSPTTQHVPRCLCLEERYVNEDGITNAYNYVNIIPNKLICHLACLFILPRPY